MSPFLRRTLPPHFLTKIAFSQLQEEGRRIFSSRALCSEKFKTTSALENSLGDASLLLLLCFSLCENRVFGQNTDVGKVKRLFQPACMEPIPATAGRQSLPCTISHPQAAPAAAWPGFQNAASAQSCFLCRVNPFASPKSGAAQWAVEPPWIPKQIPPARDLQSKQLCQSAFSLVHWVRVPWWGLCRC